MVCNLTSLQILTALVDALEVQPGATDSEIKKAYRKVLLVPLQ
jgi:curved DNA-binding protein CbpA